MVTKTNYTAGYIECEWMKNSRGNTVNIIYAEGYDFHYIHIKFDLATKILYIRAEVTDTAGCPISPISLAPLTVTQQLLEDFGVVFTGTAAQGDQFIAKIVDVMGMLGYWRKATRQGNISYKQYGRIGSNDKTYFYHSNEEEIKNLKKQLEEKNTLIREMEEEIEDLKTDLKSMIEMES